MSELDPFGTIFISKRDYYHCSPICVRSYGVAGLAANLADSLAQALVKDPAGVMSTMTAQVIDLYLIIEYGLRTVATVRLRVRQHIEKNTARLTVNVHVRGRISNPINVIIRYWSPEYRRILFC